jgi:hypothetical protein
VETSPYLRVGRSGFGLTRSSAAHPANEACESVDSSACTLVHCKWHQLHHRRREQVTLVERAPDRSGMPFPIDFLPVCATPSVCRLPLEELGGTVVRVGVHNVQRDSIDSIGHIGERQRSRWRRVGRRTLHKQPRASQWAVSLGANDDRSWLDDALTKQSVGWAIESADAVERRVESDSNFIVEPIVASKRRERLAKQTIQR